MIDSGGWLIDLGRFNVEHRHSSNFNFRPENCQISLLVVHNISLPKGAFGTGNVERLFSNVLDPRDHESFQSLQRLKVSSHLFIDRKGNCTQFVSFNERAWHAGISSFEGVGNCNDFSIGIELEGTDDIPYTDEQYESLATASRLILKRYPNITSERIAGHDDIAPGRKTDPGASFDWKRYKSTLEINNKIAT